MMIKLVLVALYKKIIKSNEINPPPAANVHTRFASASVYCVGCGKLSQRVTLASVIDGGVVACPCCHEQQFFTKEKLTALENSGDVSVFVDS